MKTKPIHYYSISTARFRDYDSLALQISRASSYLIRHRNADGIWGDKSDLDVLISTTHAAMTLMSVGYPPTSPLLAPTFDYLTTLDTDKQVNFYWRSGVLLNLPQFDDIVIHDIEYLADYHRRVGAHKDYPVLFFLLKLLRFAKLNRSYKASEEEAIKAVIGEWKEGQGWYSRPSITSMAVALIHDRSFKGKKRIVEDSIKFLSSSYQQNGTTGRFHKNLVDNAFTLFNLCESSLPSTHYGTSLAPCLRGVVEELASCQEADGSWFSEPPFGGSVGSRIYPTAVIARSLLSSSRLAESNLHEQVALLQPQENHRREANHTGAAFWGLPGLTHNWDHTCFVLMPFTTDLTSIYEEHIKKPLLEQHGIRCIRADDIDMPTTVMEYVWEGIARSSVIIADLTLKNPNVFYELGLAHAIGKRAILISQSHEKLPFDIHPIRAILYDNSPAGYRMLSTKIVKAVFAVLKS